MLEHLTGSQTKIVLFVVLSSFCVVTIYFDGWNNIITEGSVLFSLELDDFYFRDSKYLVATSKCKIHNLDAFDPEILPFFIPENYTLCSWRHLLTYVTKIDNVATLHINTTVVSSYTTNNFTCCYSNISRLDKKNDPDSNVRFSSCVQFKDNVTIQNFVLVNCTDDHSQRSIYTNTHAVLTITKPVETKMKTFHKKRNNPFSVTLVAIDSISRLNFLRSFPLTQQFLEKNKWLPLEGYNKIGDNTYPNLMAILTGFNESYADAICDPKTLNKLDHCPLIWYTYRNLDYITAYAEDEGWMTTFNYHKKGFTQPPTDYYFRPYILGSEKLKIIWKDELKYCTGPKTAGERIMNLAKDFMSTFKDYPTFSLFWMNSFSHNNLNRAASMDAKVKIFLEDISKNGAIENSFVIFLSDHGMRFGDIRFTSVGWMEGRLPFIYFSIPKRFKRQFPAEYMNLKRKRYHLTNPYDLYMTLQHILVLSGFKYKIKRSKGCPKCRSLFSKKEPERSCEDAAIEQHWCTCAGYTSINKTKEIVKDVSKYIIDQIHEIIPIEQNYSKCANYSLNKIIASSKSEKFNYKSDTYFLLIIETQPKAVFEATVLYKNNTEKEFQLQGGISRLDVYSSHSQCIDDAFLKKYCYCT